MAAIPEPTLCSLVARRLTRFPLVNVWLPLTNVERPDLRESLAISARLRCERVSEPGEEQKPRQVMAVVLALAAFLLSFHRAKVTL
jgi:hypothetical protein